MIREAILCVNSIVELTNGTYKSPKGADLDSSLPEIILEPTNNSNFPESKMKPPLIPPIQLKPDIENIKPNARARKNSQSKARTKSTGRPKVLKNDNILQLNSSSQLQRSQSVRNQKKNNKGELPIHLAVMKVSNNLMNKQIWQVIEKRCF